MKRALGTFALFLPTVAILGGGELFLRHRLGHEWPWGIVRDDAELGWSLNPGWAGSYHGAEVRVSDAGLRDPRSAAELARGGATLFLGDSVVMGYGIPEDASVARQLEARIGTPVVNAGVVGFGTRQEAALLRRLDPLLQPSRIVVGMCLNDIAPEDQYRLRVAPRGTAAALSERMRERSALFHWMRKRVRRILERTGGLEEGRTGDLDLGVLAARLAADPSGAMAEVERGLEEMRSIARGRPLLAVLFPYRQQLAEPLAPTPQAALAAAARAAEIPSLDLLPVLAGAPAADGLFVDNCHLNPAGSRIAADAIAVALGAAGSPARLLDLPASSADSR